MSSDKGHIYEDGQVLLLNKPPYWTSFDLVNKIRIMIKENLGLKKIKVGHAGTLDPLATGLMIICTGKATKRIEEFRDLDKEYEAIVHFGETTPSFDLETETDGKYPTEHITEALLEEILHSFRGIHEQMPPLHSAKLIDGKRAYEFARKGVEKELKPVIVNFREIELLWVRMPEAKIRLLCSKGTYIRSFARDLGKALGSGAYLAGLVRTSIGKFRLSEAFSLEKLDQLLRE